MSKPELKVLTRHPIDIYPEEGDTMQLPSDVGELGELRASEPRAQKLGEVMLGRLAVPLGEITYGTAVNVPPDNPNAYYVTSKLSIAAVVRTPGLEGLAPRLLYPFNPVYDAATGKCLGVSGLALPNLDACPRRQIAYNPDLPRVPLFEDRVQNTCPYPFTVYDIITPNVVSEDNAVARQLPVGDQRMRVEYAKDAPLDQRLSEQLGVPIYRPEVVGVENDHCQGMWQLCHLDVPTAMKDAAMHLIGGSLVRSKETGQMCGFRQLYRIAPVHFGEPVF